MKLIAFQRAAFSALMSLSLVVTGLPISAQTRPMMDTPNPPPHANNDQDEKKNPKKRDEQILRQQKRIAHLRFQEAYGQRLLQQRTAVMNARYDYYNDPFYYTGPSYRYRRGSQYYTTNEIGMEILKQALNQGYKEGCDGGRKYGSGGDDNNEWWIAAGVIGAILAIEAINS